jgi:7,8-dihydropterin-6-yl-methyl-4-(beta-D-ribofuranosyl)aminobenzene 5'-phosphate synthase
VTHDLATLTILIDNTPGGDTLPAEHGFSCVLRRGEHQILFDTGKSDLLLRNAAALGIDLLATDAIVLSHGHYDHTGGLKGIIDAGVRAPIHMHPDALKPHYGRDPDTRVRFIGSPIDTDTLRAATKIVAITAPTEILAGICATGPVPRENDFEDAGGDFWCDPSCTIADTIVDDQSLYFETSHGTVVVLGCAHAGVINTLRYVQKLTNTRRIHAVLGGMHLPHASTHRIDATLAALREFNIAVLAPMHCTGTAATEKLRQTFPRSFHAFAVGSTLTL